MPAKSRSIGSNLKKIDRHKITPEEYDEAPEWTEEDFAEATLRHGDTIIRRGRPPLDPTERKQSVTLRLDANIVSAYRATGDGWQSRINADLAKSAKRLKA